MSEGEREQREAELLDAYLGQLQAGLQPDRQSVLREYPELASMLDYLEALEQVAPLASASAGDAADDDPPEDDSPPRDFGAYELMGEIGRGGMGVVYKARQKALDRIVAVKMILASHLASPDQIRRFHEEARAAASLRHSHIVHIHEVGQCHGQHYFAMEYIEGTSLAARIAAGPLDPPSAVRLVAKVARAVDHLHRQAYLHRDLKPSNILLDGDGEPYVTDFGLAKALSPGSEPTATGVIAGTPSYMAPEQAAGHGAEVGPASDVYSLGAILYELLTGRPPFREENALDTLLAVLGGDPPLPRQLNRHIPRALEWICLKCLARCPADRYLSAAALADDLERFLQGEVLEARPPHLLQRAWRWARREPALAIRLTALAIFYLVGLTNYWTRTINLSFHASTSILLAVWAAGSVVFQQLLKTQRWSLPARFGWGTIDAGLFLAILLVADGAASSLIVGYPLLIVASGLWYRVRFVWFMTALSLVSYSVLIFDFYHRRPELQQRCYPGADRHVIFILALLVLAAITAYLVARIRALSSYYGQKV